MFETSCNAEVAADYSASGSSLLHLSSLFSAFRGSAVSVSSVVSAGSVRGNDPSLEALSEVRKAISSTLA